MKILNFFKKETAKNVEDLIEVSIINQTNELLTVMIISEFFKITLSYMEDGSNRLLFEKVFEVDEVLKTSKKLQSKETFKNNILGVSVTKVINGTSTIITISDTLNAIDTFAFEGSHLESFSISNHPSRSFPII